MTEDSPLSTGPGQRQGIPYLDDAERERVLNEGDAQQRCWVAMQKDLSQEHALRIAADPSAEVAQFLVQGASNARSLDILADAHPELALFAAQDPNASPELKKQLPFFEHSEYSLSRFAHEVGAGEEQQRELLQRYRQDYPRGLRSGSPGGPPLADVWKVIARSGR